MKEANNNMKSSGIEGREQEIEPSSSLTPSDLLKTTWRQAKQPAG